MEENLKWLEQFFKRDLNIKSALNNSSRGIEDNAGWLDKLDDNFEDIEYEFSKITETGYLSGKFETTVKDKLEEIKDRMKKESEPANIYKDCFTNMDEKLVADVKKSFIGYTFDNFINLDSLIKRCQTVNELLHVLHSYVLNSEDILQDMPRLENRYILKDENGNEVEDDGYRITLYGSNNKENKIAKELFENFPEKMNGHYTSMVDIIGLEDRTLMMIRDYGHALSIEIDCTENKNSPQVTYNVPKICNLEMVNKLRGVKKIKKEDGFSPTGGSFVIDDVSNVCKEMFDFIKTVPTDYDIPKTKIEIESTKDSFIEDSRQIIFEENSMNDEFSEFSMQDIKELGETRQLKGIKKVLYIFKDIFKENGRER